MGPVGSKNRLLSQFLEKKTLVFRMFIFIKSRQGKWVMLDQKIDY